MSFTKNSGYEPWAFRIDANLDGVFSISDIWTFLGQLFFLPGDSLTYLVLNFLPGVTTFLEYSPDDYHGFLSSVFSVLVWLDIAGLYFRLKDYLKEREAKAKLRVDNPNSDSAYTDENEK